MSDESEDKGDETQKEDSIYSKEDEIPIEWSENKFALLLKDMICYSQIFVASF